jgi:SAM-dependent methyltransferase
MADKKDSGKADLDWNDDHVLPAHLSLDTEFVFQRMTEETLKAARSGNGHRVLDVGCGRGIDATSMAKKGGVLFGCEPSRVMLRKAKDYVKEVGEKVRLVSSLAETLPFMNKTFTRVVCKGAIDHFGNPEQAVSEMCRVTAADGKVVISVANFESLSCSLARNLHRLSQRFVGKVFPAPHIWEIPPDHTFKFDYSSIIALAVRHLQVELIQGVSLLWGFPRWSNALKILPRPLALILLCSLDKIASWHPAWSDVLIIAGRPLRSLPEKTGVKEMGDTSRVWGGLLCAAIIGVAILFLWGISLQNYWALAIPVIIGFLGILALGFWIGWTILTIKTTPPTAQSTPQTLAEKKENPTTQGK